jgi:staphylococcal nuclease domain-containing protein 1
MKHRQDDQDRSLYYDDLIQAEAAAARDKKGLHGDKKPPPRNINDVSQASALAQAKQMFGFIQRAGVMKGVVQHVVNGARYKVLIPAQTCIITLALAGIRCPQTGRKDGEPGEPYGEEAYMFARDKCLQHDVDVEVLAQDKVGAMIGRLKIHNKCMATVMLENGYARLTGRDVTNEMEKAEEVSCLLTALHLCLSIPLYPSPPCPLLCPCVSLSLSLAVPGPSAPSQPKNPHY